ncbi:MAG: PorV/PorQ family protein [Candidatus Cloacimonas sp.]
MAFSFLILMPLMAQHQDAGTTGFSTLKIIYSARANAMGQAMLGRNMNFDGMQFNPATLIRIENKGAFTTLADHFVGSGGGSVGYVVPKNIYTSYGFYLNYWNSGSIDRTDIGPNGEFIELDDTFSAQDIAAGFAVAKFVSPALDAGGSVKLVLDQIDGKSATAALIDVGILHHTPNERVKVGLSARNLGFQLSHYTDNKYSEGIPVTYGVGLGINAGANSLLNIDLTKATGENFIGKLGIEQRIHPALVLRGGFKTNAGDYSMGGSMGWTSGISLGLGWLWKNYAIDYAISSYGDLGLTNQVSLRYNLN